MKLELFYEFDSLKINQTDSSRLLAMEFEGFSNFLFEFSPPYRGTVKKDHRGSDLSPRWKKSLAKRPKGRHRAGRAGNVGHRGQAT